MRFDLADLHLFLNVAETGSITHGAERSNLALGSASGRIRAMEETLGAPLLARLRHGVSPTPAGECLLDHARLMLRQADRMRGEMAEYARGMTGTLKLLSNTAALTDHLPRLLAAFLKENPTINLDIEEMESAQIGKAIVAGHADIGIAASSELPAGLICHPFREDRLVLVSPRGTFNTKCGGVSFSDVVERPFVGLSYASALQRHISSQAAQLGKKMRIRARVSSFLAMGQMVEAGAGFAIMPEIAAARCRKAMQVDVDSLTDGWARRDLAICACQSDNLPQVAERLIKHLCQ